ncbi:hypothetical protein BU25DRAFT_195679 [Macroventuria anomochaeta]|uniref:Uncharacterized protein n=1 Tax=Macroventuria anomochaeta TaxID=301207 RepID=A0ACB6SEP2_9PLEO|nr:uncharacterized protein BU25DRAFT_195679 [Macroventuria anomochaeta]KAF2631734.1 hypothetical protein BU25DRAFT_195679 [Macroventuria anomochaeta]
MDSRLEEPVRSWNKACLIACCRQDAILGSMSRTDTKRRRYKPPRRPLQQLELWKHVTSVIFIGIQPSYKENSGWLSGLSTFLQECAVNDGLRCGPLESTSFHHQYIRSERIPQHKTQVQLHCRAHSLKHASIVCSYSLALPLPQHDANAKYHLEAGETELVEATPLMISLNVLSRSVRSA